MLDRAAGDRTSKLGDLFGDGTGIGLIETFQRELADAVQVCVIAPDQLDEDGFLGVEVVVEAAREDARGVGDLLQRSTKSGRRDDGVRRLEDLRAPRRIDRRFVGDGGEFRGALTLLTRRPAASGTPPRGVGVGHR